MAIKALARRLQLPPKGRPYWLPSPSTGSEMSYLSWGNRWFGESPIEPSLHDGWHYFAVLKGAPTIQVGSRQIKASQGNVFITHPDCPIGHKDKPGQQSRIIAWIWRTPPVHTKLQPAEGSFLSVMADQTAVNRLESIRGDCHRAVAAADESGQLALKSARIQLDLTLVSALGSRREASTLFRYNLATVYLQNNLNRSTPIRDLSEYLQISAASLKRLFQKHAGKSPWAIYMDLKMAWARERLSTEKASVKMIAYSLGYKHSNDFSRAFKRSQGFEARRLLSGRTAQD